jgi:hypothetical protein
MKMKKSCLYLGTVMTAALLAGCVERRVVYVHDPAPVPATPPGTEAALPPSTPPPGEVPPAPQTEVVTVSPGPAYAWVPGVWVWRGRWVWGPGHWAVGPHPHALWVQGHWERRGRRSYWVEGYWR